MSCLHGCAEFTVSPKNLDNSYLIQGTQKTYFYDRLYNEEINGISEILKEEKEKEKKKEAENLALEHPNLKSPIKPPIMLQKDQVESMLLFKTAQKNT